MKVSIVVPLYNEAENVEQLYRELLHVAEHERRITEMILVDEGAVDTTAINGEDRPLTHGADFL